MIPCARSTVSARLSAVAATLGPSVGWTVCLLDTVSGSVATVHASVIAFLRASEVRPSEIRPSEVRPSVRSFDRAAR